MKVFGAAVLISIAFAAPSIHAASPTPLPAAPTEVVLPAAVGAGKPTAGDVVELLVEPPIDVSSGARPVMADGLEKGPVEFGTGRILWWRPADGNGTIRLGLTTYTPGKFEIGSVIFVKAGQEVFASQPQAVEYSAVGGDKSKDDIYPPASVGFPRWVWILLGLLALALVLGSIWWLARWSQRRRAKIEELARAPKIYTPIEEFERTRAATDQKGFVSQGEFKRHYFALSDAAKRFLGRAYRFDAEERTTRELLRDLEGLGMSISLIDQWEKILDEMDVTKFTDQIPEAVAASSLSARLEKIVIESYRASPVWRESQMKLQNVAASPTAGGAA